ncbi:MAG: carbon-nitrogen hydrolase family protein [Magnetococcales bacterium]|nr:carbon-nitrogen hydrolase family protein [Magnetococcales bacterium]
MGKGLAAVVQMCSGPDRSENLRVAERLMEEAVARGAELIVLPENFSFLGRDDSEKRNHREEMDASPSLDFLLEFAIRRKVWIVGGSIPLAVPDAGMVTSTCFLVSNTGTVAGRYDKIHLFDANLGAEPYRESAFIKPGRQAVTADTPFGRLGFSICYDLRFPEHFRRLVDQGATLFALPSAFTQQTGKDHWEILVRARAVENFSYMLAAGQWGWHAGGRRTYGHSMIVEPWGTVVARCPDGNGIALAEIDPARVTTSRTQIPCLQHRVI